MPAPPSEIDPQPLPPLRPGNEDCCRGGCEFCVFTLYQEALERYEVKLLAWEKRNPGKQGKHQNR